VQTGELNANGCSWVPNTLFNEAACNIHDLCYITPGASKRDCDQTFVSNIISIYCDNVNPLERLSCVGRAQLAGAVVSAIDSFYDDSAGVRASCRPTNRIPVAVLAGGVAIALLFILVASLLARRPATTADMLDTVDAGDDMEKEEEESKGEREDNTLEIEEEESNFVCDNIICDDAPEIWSKFHSDESAEVNIAPNMDAVLVCDADDNSADQVDVLDNTHKSE